MQRFEDRALARIEAGDRRPLREILVGELGRHSAAGPPAPARACPAASAIAAATREVERLRATALRARDTEAAARLAGALDALQHAHAALAPAAPTRRRATVPARLVSSRWTGGLR